MADVVAWIAIDPDCDALNRGRSAGEHCAVGESLLDRLQSSVGSQLLVRRSAGRLALYTVARTVSEPDDGLLVGTPGLRRLTGADAALSVDRFRATIDTAFAGRDEGGRAWLTEQLLGRRATGLAILAPHGGNIEPDTDIQAEIAFGALAEAGKPTRAWIARGYKRGGGAHRCWHITSAEISERSFPKLGSLFVAPGGRGPFAHAIALHGHDDSDALVVGGGLAGDRPHEARKHELARRLRDTLEAVAGHPVAVEVSDGGPLAGADPRNIVNRVTVAGNGLQIEQPPAVREDEQQRDAVARVIAEFYAELI